MESICAPIYDLVFFYLSQGPSGEAYDAKFATAASSIKSLERKATFTAITF